MACSRHAAVVQPWNWVRTGILTVLVRMSLWLLIGGRLVTLSRNAGHLKILGDGARRVRAPRSSRFNAWTLEYHVTQKMIVHVDQIASLWAISIRLEIIIYLVMACPLVATILGTCDGTDVVNG